MFIATKQKSVNFLGGKCADTGENLGKPLPNIVSTYFSAAGVNWGMNFWNLKLLIFIGMLLCNK
jgi:hypothetical protein